MAERYGPVVAGVDGSADSIGALRWAADEAERWTRMLEVVSVLPPDGAGEGGDIAERAAAEARRWRVGVAAFATTERGSPVRVLRRHAERSRMLVVGGRGAGAARNRPLGSVSEALGARAGCPVLVVHDARRWAAADAALPRTGPVVVGFDGSDSARRALRLAFEEAAYRYLRLVIVQAWPHPGLWHPGAPRGADLSAREGAVREALRSAARPWCDRYPNLEVEVRGEPGDPVETLAVVSQWACLLVVGTRCPADAVQPVNPSVTRRLLEYAACPVLVAHGPTRVPAATVAAAS